MAFKIAELVQGIGLIVALLGASQVVLGVYLGLVSRPVAQPAAGATSTRPAPGGI